MAYANTAAILRADINTVLMEAAQVDSLFIGDKVFPVYPSPVKSGQYPKFKLASGEILNNDTLARAQGGNYPRIIRAYETDTFNCVDRGLEEAVDDTYARDVARFFDAETVAAKMVYRQVRLAHEVRIAAALLNASTFRATAASVAYTEANLATIAFHTDVLNANDRLNAKGIIPNAVVMSGNLFNRVRRSTLAQNFIRGAGKATDATLLLSPSDLALSLGNIGITQVIVGALQYNSNVKGNQYSATAVWGNTYFWVGRIESGDFMNGGAGRTIAWDQGGGVLTTETYRDEQKVSDIVRVRQHTAEKVIDSTAGELITTSYS